MTEKTFLSGSGDCWGYWDEYGYDGFSASGTSMYIGGCNLFEMNVRTWIPFSSITLPAGTEIESAVVKWYATQTRSDGPEMYIGCEDADSPSSPVTLASLQGRTMTSAKTHVDPIPSYTDGNLYSYDVTAAVQEVLDRAGWAYGNTLAVLVANGTPRNDYRRLIAAYENTTYTQPQLVIEYAGFVPNMLIF